MNEKAPKGRIWQCQACGKLAWWRYGFDDHEQPCAHYGYDESCMMNAELVNITPNMKLPKGG